MIGPSLIRSNSYLVQQQQLICLFTYSALTEKETGNEEEEKREEVVVGKFSHFASFVAAAVVHTVRRLVIVCPVGYLVSAATH